MLYPFKSSTIARSTWTKLICFLFVVVLSNVTVDLSFGSDTTERLRTTVARMNQWLGTGSNARQWRNVLELNVLDSQTAKGEQADSTTLRNVLNRFDKHAASKHPIFLEVRNAIEAQIYQLDRIQSSNMIDLQFATQQAIAQFQKPTIADLEAARDLARYELDVFRQAYRANYGIGTRAAVFQKLELDEAIEFLSQLEIEMPPEVSVGKMNSMIADERKRLEEVTDKIDALPMESPSEDSDEDGEDLDIELTPPGPDTDDEEDLETLEAREEAIRGRINELLSKGREIAKQDRPRQRRRSKAGGELRRMQRRFRELAKERTDTFFYAAKQAVDRFADAYVLGTEDNIQQEFLDKVTELANLMPELTDMNAQLSHARVGNILYWLENRQQLKDLCVAIRRRHSNPNAYVSVSSRMVQGLTSRTSSESDQIAEDFLGRFARGVSYTTTNVNLVTIPNPNQVQVSILLNGTASTDTYIRERKFRVDSLACGNLSARRDLFGNLNGLIATKATAAARISTQFDGIDSNCRLVQRIAKKSFQKEQGNANAEATRRAKLRLENRFVSETSGVINKAADQIDTYSSKAREFSSLLPQIYLRSFSQRIEAVAKKDTRFAMGATSQPVFQTAGSDIQLKLHESMLSNYLDLIFANQKFTKSDFEEELASLGFTGELFPETEDSEEVEDFEITFPEVRPVQLVFANNRLGVRVTGERFKQGENEIKTRVVIEVNLKIVSRQGKLFLALDGKPNVDFAEDEEPDAESIAFVEILEERLGEAVEKSGTTGFELPPNLIPPIENLQGNDIVRALQLGLLELSDGWLYLGWNWQGGVFNTPAIWNEVIVEDINPLYLEEIELNPGETVEGKSVLIVEPVFQSGINVNSIGVPTLIGQ